MALVQSFVQTAQFTSSVVVTTAVTLSSPVAIGDVVVLQTSTGNVADQAALLARSPTVTDNLGGNVYTRLTAGQGGSLVDTLNSQGTDVWVCFVTKAGTPTLTFTPNGGTGAPWLAIQGDHYNGTDATSTIRDSKGAVQSNPGLSSNAITTTSVAAQSGDILIGLTNDSGSGTATLAIGTGFTAASAVNGTIGGITEFQIAGGAGPVTFTDGTSGNARTYMTIGIAITPAVTSPLAGTLTQTLPTTSTSTTGWTVGTVAAGNYSRMTYNAEVGSANFTATVQPAGPPSTGGQDCWRSAASLFGQFRPGWWTSSVSVIGVTSGGDADGRVRVNVFKTSDPLGGSAQTLTRTPMIGTTVTNLSTSVAQTSTASAYIDLSNFTHEYLFVQAAWEITGVGGAADRDVLVRFGQMNLTDGSGLVTSEFSDLTPAAGGAFGTGYFMRRRMTDSLCAMDEI